MEKHLFVSCFIVFGLYVTVLVCLFIRRFKDSTTGVTDPRYFKTYDMDATIPKRTAQLVRNYANLAEAPIFFFAIILLILTMKLTHIHFVYLAYAYAGSRVLHSLIHITSNKLFPRIGSFMFSSLLLVALWGTALFHVLSR